MIALAQSGACGPATTGSELRAKISKRPCGTFRVVSADCFITFVVVGSVPVSGNTSLFDQTTGVGGSILLFVSISAAQQTSTADVPNMIRYSRTFKAEQGVALCSSTAVGVIFSIYKQQDGGTAVWMESKMYLPTAMADTLILGSTTAIGLPGDLFSEPEQRLWRCRCRITPGVKR